MNLPIVTILLSTHNGEKYLQQQLDSLSIQKNVSVKVLARDDGSSDHTLDILKKNATNIHMSFYQGTNIGARESFFDLIKRVDLESDYYAFCDQDDVWLENKLEKAIEQLKNTALQTPSLYYSYAKQVGASLEEVGTVFKKHYHVEDFAAALVNASAPGCTMVCNKVTMNYLKMYKPQYASMHDNWTILMCLAINGTVIYDENSYILYRQHSNNVVGGIERFEMNKLGLFKYRIKKMFTFSYNYHKTSAQLLEGYAEIMTPENRSLCELIAKADKSILNRIKILFHPKLKTPYFLINLHFRLATLLNQL